MRIAYLILAHNNYRHLERAIAALQGEHCKFYIHIDGKSPMPKFNSPNIHFVKKRIRVHWAGFSQVITTMELLRAGIAEKNDYFALISGTHYPIQPNPALLNILKAGGEYIELNEGVNAITNPEERYTWYYFTDYYDRKAIKSPVTVFFRGLQASLRSVGCTKSIPFPIYHGSQWFILSRACVRYILKEVERNRSYLRFFKKSFCPDESFFHTIVGNSPFKTSVKGSLTYVDWSGPTYPAEIREDHIRRFIDLRRSGQPIPFFVRKLNDNSKEVCDLIDTTLRSQY